MTPPLLLVSLTAALLPTPLVHVTWTLAVAAEPQAEQTREATSYEPYDGHKEQFTIELPKGWTAYDQELTVMRRQSPFGMIIFSPMTLAQLEGKEQMEAFVKIGTGEATHFFVDRGPAPKGTSCAAFPEKARKQVRKMVESDQMFSKGAAVIEPPQIESATVGGCQGIRMTGRTKTPDGAEWRLEMRIVSDGDVNYMFTLRNKSAAFAETLPVFEKSVSTVKMSVSK